jgi:hypothetical protein
VILGVLELLYESTVVVANVKLLPSFTLLLAAGMIFRVGDVHPLRALSTTQ